jgi:hypothetical protein
MASRAAIPLTVLNVATSHHVIYQGKTQGPGLHLIWPRPLFRLCINAPEGRAWKLRLVTLVITTCTSRKRRPAADGLHVAALPQTGVSDLASDWASRLSAEPARFPAKDIYGGRNFREALAAAELLDAQAMVVSAGLGLIYVSTQVPAYSCTVVVDAPDSVGSRVIGHFSASAWWGALGDTSPFAVALQDAAEQHNGLICAALSDAYIEMIAADWLALPDAVLARLRLFTRAPIERVAEGLRPFVMPYDDRLDGPDSPIRGTRSDFPGRALHHFSELSVMTPDARSLSEHAAAVTAALDGWRMPAKVDRARHDDASLLEMIRQHWDVECGSSSRLLRRFRDDLGVACEQGRFARLARVVRSERA